MRSPLRAVVAGTALAALALTALQAPASAAPTAHDGATASGAAARSDDRPGPWMASSAGCSPAPRPMVPPKSRRSATACV